MPDAVTASFLRPVVGVHTRLNVGVHRAPVLRVDPREGVVRITVGPPDGHTCQSSPLDVNRGVVQRPSRRELTAVGRSMSRSVQLVLRGVIPPALRVSSPIGDCRSLAILCIQLLPPL